MRKLVIYVFIFFSMLLAHAGATPYYTYDVKYPGIGVIEFDNDVTIYEKPNVNSEVLMTLEVAPKTGNMLMMNERTSAYYFLAQNPEKKLAYLVALDEQDDGWIQVCYSQQDNLTGWVKSSLDKVQPWREFFTVWGKKNGLYIFKDVPTEAKKLYAKPFDDKDDARVVEGFKNAYKINLVYIKGNWMLVRVLDVGNAERIGYIRWRDTDGKLFMFPLMK